MVANDEALFIARLHTYPYRASNRVVALQMNAVLFEWQPLHCAKLVDVMRQMHHPASLKQ